MTLQTRLQSMPTPHAHSYNWHQVWFSALFHPTPKSYQRWLGDLNTSPLKSGIWIAITSAIGAIITAFLFSPKGALALMLILGTPMYVVISLVIMTTFAGILQGLSRVLGGTGSFTKTAYSIAAFDAPITPLLVIVLGLPLGWVWFALGTVYGMWLMMVAVKSVHQFNWKRTAVACSPVFVVTIISVMVSLPFYMRN